MFNSSAMTKFMPFFDLVEETRDEKELKRLKNLLNKMLKKIEKPDSKEGTTFAKYLKMGYEEAEKSVKDFLREQEELGEMFGIKKESKKGKN